VSANRTTTKAEHFSKQVSNFFKIKSNARKPYGWAEKRLMAFLESTV